MRQHWTGLNISERDTNSMQNNGIIFRTALQAELLFPAGCIFYTLFCQPGKGCELKSFFNR